MVEAQTEVSISESGEITITFSHAVMFLDILRGAEQFNLGEAQTHANPLVREGARFRALAVAELLAGTLDLLERAGFEYVDGPAPEASFN